MDITDIIRVGRENHDMTVVYNLNETDAMASYTFRIYLKENEGNDPE